MNVGGPLLSATRLALETTYGLALEGLNEDQIQAAVYGAASSGMADARDPEFLARVVDRLPIDESWLFRDDGLWEWLREAAGMEMLERASRSARKVRILSLGCASGQEAFTAAMLFQDLLEKTGLPPSAAASHVQVLGLDSSPSRIEAARSGLLPAWSVQRCRSDWLRGRVTPEPGPTGHHRVAPAIQAMCRFDVGNLVDLAASGNAALGGHDLVLCRNVLIYFRPEQADGFARELARGLDPGAHLVVSAPEAHLLARGDLEAVGFLGVGRAAPRTPTIPVARRPVAHQPAAQRVAPSAAASSHPRPADAVVRRRPPDSAPEPPRDAAAALHVEEALRHAEAGRRDAALRSARAALVHDPSHLYSQLVLGQQLLSVDVERARQILRVLVKNASRLSPDEPVPCADGLSVGQLAAAARILIMRREDA